MASQQFPRTHQTRLILRNATPGEVLPSWAALADWVIDRGDYFYVVKIAEMPINRAIAEFALQGFEVWAIERFVQLSWVSSRFKPGEVEQIIRAELLSAKR
jgi:hypothetical protein